MAVAAATNSSRVPPSSISSGGASARVHGGGARGGGIPGGGEGGEGGGEGGGAQWTGNGGRGRLHPSCSSLPPSPPRGMPPPLPSPSGCLKSCSDTPCGRCATGCSAGTNCKTPSGRASSFNECTCNFRNTTCDQGLALCPPPPFPSPPPKLEPWGKVLCKCDPGFSGPRCSVKISKSIN